MKTSPGKPSLRSALVSAINQREATLRNGTCQRRDYDAIRASIAKAEAFLRSYPFADDTRVQSWCKDHHHDLCRIVPGNQPRVLARLLFQEIERRVALAHATDNDPASLAGSVEHQDTHVKA